MIPARRLLASLLLVLALVGFSELRKGTRRERISDAATTPTSIPAGMAAARLLPTALPNASRWTPQRTAHHGKQQSSVLAWATPYAHLGVESTLITQVTPPFQFAYSRRDSIVRSLRAHGMIEPAVTRGWVDGVRACCARGGRVFDVGANYGWYTLLSLALGASCDRRSERNATTERSTS
jgi:hypothetical protein